MNGTPDVFYITIRPLSEAQVPLYGQKGMGITFDPDVLTELAGRLQLSYLSEESSNTEMCFLHSPDVRPEFRISFYLRDFADFVQGVLREQGKLVGSADLGSERLPIPYPEDPDVFWRLASAGALKS